MDHVPQVDRTLSSRVMDVLEKAGLTPQLAAHRFRGDASKIGHLVVSILRHPEAWRRAEPTFTIDVREWAWEEIQDMWKEKLHINWRQVKDRKLRAERTEEGRYEIALLTLDDPHLVNVSYEAQKTWAETRGLVVPNAPTAVVLLLTLADHQIHFPFRSFRTSSHGKEGRRMEVKISEKRALLETGLPDEAASEFYGLMCARKKPLESE